VRRPLGESLGIFLTFAVILPAAFMVNGCTFAGFIAGTIVDHQDISSIPRAALDTLKPGAFLIITPFDGPEKTGRFVGIDGVPDSLYRATYMKERSALSNEVSLPRLGTVVDFSDTAGKIRSGKLWGFDIDDKARPFALIKLPNRDNADTIRLSLIGKMTDSLGVSTDVAELSQLMTNNRLHAMSEGIIIADSTGRMRFNFWDVESVEVDEKPWKKRNAWLLGAGAGLVTDAILFSFYKTVWLYMFVVPDYGNAQ
jgi:hypothetical protein